MMVLGQYMSALVNTCWYWVSIGPYWLVLGGTGSVEGSKGRKYLDIRLKRSEIRQFSGF